MSATKSISKVGQRERRSSSPPLLHFRIDWLFAPHSPPPADLRLEGLLGCGAFAKVYKVLPSPSSSLLPQSSPLASPCLRQSELILCWSLQGWWRRGVAVKKFKSLERQASPAASISPMPRPTPRHCREDAQRRPAPVSCGESAAERRH